MSFRIKLKNAVFTKIAQYVGYPVLTGLTDLYFMGVDANTTRDNRTQSGVDGNVAGTLTYGTYEAIQASTNAALITETVDNTQAVTLICIMKVPNRAATNFGFAISNFIGGGALTASNLISIGKQNSANTLEFVVSPQNNGTPNTFAKVTAPYPATANYIFLAGTIDSSGLMRLFVSNNGALSKTTNASGPVARTFNGNKLHILNSVERVVDAPISMAMAAIHKVSLSDGEITTIYNNLKSFYEGKITVA